ncbi:hypothetical protein F4801DRAFT_386819 [Xylaria longipes]|nr:hypothetical protein F4801DRAFT_386819 [Xylaria longipes]
MLPIGKEGLARNVGWGYCTFLRVIYTLRVVGSSGSELHCRIRTDRMGAPSRSIPRRGSAWAPPQYIIRISSSPRSWVATGRGRSLAYSFLPRGSLPDRPRSQVWTSALLIGTLIEAGVPVDELDQEGRFDEFEETKLSPRANGASSAYSTKDRQYQAMLYLPAHREWSSGLGPESRDDHGGRCSCWRRGAIKDGIALDDCIIRYSSLRFSWTGVLEGGSPDGAETSRRWPLAIGDRVI